MLRDAEIHVVEGFLTEEARPGLEPYLWKDGDPTSLDALEKR
jgi:hypothetical protein